MARLEAQAVTRTDVSEDVGVPRLGLSRRDAAASLGISIDSFERYVQPEIRIVRKGRMRIVPAKELERWLAENAERPLGEWRNRSAASGRLNGHV